MLDRIARAACGEHTPVVLEIGPGKGALTAALLECADRVIAIEVDAVLVHYLRQKFQEAITGGRLELIEGDVLALDLAHLAERPVVAGNLPYYITSPILERVLALGGACQRAVFLVQSEVAHRITAAPGTRDFGYLSVMVQAQSHAELLFAVPREAFRPPPKVESAVVRLTPREAGIADLPGFLKFAKLCFRQKRKTLRNNLLPVYGPERVEGLPEARLRAEQLSVEQLIGLHEKLGARS